MPVFISLQCIIGFTFMLIESFIHAPALSLSFPRAACVTVIYKQVSRLVTYTPRLLLLFLDVVSSRLMRAVLTLACSLYLLNTSPLVYLSFFVVVVRLHPVQQFSPIFLFLILLPLTTTTTSIYTSWNCTTRRVMAHR